MIRTARLVAVLSWFCRQTNDKMEQIRTIAGIVRKKLTGKKIRIGSEADGFHEGTVSKVEPVSGEFWQETHPGTFFRVWFEEEQETGENHLIEATHAFSEIFE